jgi:6-phosphogluconolactonase
MRLSRSLPRILASELVKKKNLQFDKWYVFYADERCVPLSHEDSNHRSVFENFLSKVSPQPKVFPIDEKLAGDPDACAREYSKTLLQQLPISFKEGNGHQFDMSGVPVFDMVLLGMGPDAHTCSLFPNHTLLNESVKFVASIKNSPKPPPNRITLTFPMLYQSNKVVFVATGGSKKEVVPYVVGQKQGQGDNHLFPSRMVQNRYPITWYLDSEAVADLEKRYFSHI